VVREGETLWDISQMYAVRLENLLDFNRFETVQRLQRGRIVWLQTTRPKNKPIEYVELPDEFAEIDKTLSKETPIAKNEIIKDSITNNTYISIPKEIDLKSLPLSQDIAKSQTQKTTTENSNSNTKNVVPKEIERNAARINSLPSSQEIKKEQDKNIVKNEVPKEIDINSLPLSQEIRKEQSKSVNLSKSVDSKVVTSPKVEEDKEESKVILKGTKQNAESKKPYSEQVANREENKSEVKYKYHTVQKDETLFRISINYNVSLENLWKLNSLSSTIVEVGTVLKIKQL
jgi:membrane-bound lytic murein transglycosylase D